MPILAYPLKTFTGLRAAAETRADRRAPASVSRTFQPPTRA